ncbi:hypothetical protein GCM10011341_18590 [Frigidibacter albus]|uniref:hypothetical protein n=1 Tax=Frigidibacter albus TaxID=1465486 RepID=UPI0019A8BE89|nr:hypothetical protein [Frigidibacter albus]GGH53275.1 hypothetical protein GCM10011341_18590 [Frigidibacter albus]
MQLVREGKAREILDCIDAVDGGISASSWSSARLTSPHLRGTRASLPEGWTIGDKSGAGDIGSRSIVAVLRTPAGDPWLAAVYLTGNNADMDARNTAVARIGAAMVAEITAR